MYTCMYCTCAGNLSNMVRKIGCLTKLSKEEDPAMWCVVIGNVMYISWSVLKALKYLDEHNIQHCDVKGTINQWKWD